MMADRADAATVLRTWVAALSGAAEDVAALYADETHYSTGHTGVTARTRAEVLAFESRIFEGYGDRRSEVLDIVGDGPVAAARCLHEATHVGPVRMPDGEVLAATHRRLSLIAAEFVRVDTEGLIVEHHRIMDTATHGRQLGDA